MGFTQQTFNFNSGQTEQAFSLPVVDDDDIEPTEQFAVLATSSAPGVLVQPNRVVVDIEDNDGACYTHYKFTLHTLEACILRKLTLKIKMRHTLIFSTRVCIFGGQSVFL